MGVNEIEKLRMLLENVSDSYEDFVEGAMSEAKDDETFAGKVIAFIESHPEATSSDVIRFETEEIFGIKPIS